MANEQNLIPFNKQTKNEQRENARKGGKKSGEVRRKRKAMKEQMEMLLSLPLSLETSNGEKVAEFFKKLGIDEKEIDNQMAMIVALWQTAINSKSSQQIQAVQEIRKIVNDEQMVADKEKIQIINDLPNDKEDE